ncbi:MAG: lysophospholipid acyltransferase family protein [Fibrobacterota bacterium]
MKRLLLKSYTFVYMLYLALFMIVSISLFIPLGILSLPGLRSLRRRFVTILGRFWAKMVVTLTGSRVTLHGREHFPQDNRYCLLANHQGIFDIPVLMSAAPWGLAFIAKKELRTMPIIGWWMRAIGVIFLDRSSRRQALEVIRRGGERIHSGTPMVIFPEGTRSRGGAVAPFKKGSLKLAVKNSIPVVPVSISGTYRIFEQNRYITPAHITITVHPPVSTENLSRDDMDRLNTELRDTISGAVTAEPS